MNTKPPKKRASKSVGTKPFSLFSTTVSVIINSPYNIYKFYNKPINDSNKLTTGGLIIIQIAEVRKSKPMGQICLLEEISNSIIQSKYHRQVKKKLKPFFPTESLPAVGGNPYFYGCIFER